MKRRLFALSLAALLACGTLASCSGPDGGSNAGDGKQEDYPTSAITCIVNWSAGGPADLSTRALAAAMEKELGVPVTVVNKEGGSGTVGMSELAHAKNDGYTFGMVNHNALCLLPFQMDLSYTLEDFDIFTTFNIYEYALAVPASLGVTNLDEFFAWSKENLPDGINGAGAGYPHPLTMGDLCELAGQKFTWVPTDGTAETVQNLLGNHIYLGSATSGDFLPYVESGELTVIANTCEERSKAFPDIPTAKEQGYDVAYSSYGAFAFPAGTEQYKIDIIKAAFDKAVQDQTFLDTCERLKFVTQFLDGDTYTKMVMDDRDMYEELMKQE